MAGEHKQAVEALVKRPGALGSLIVMDMRRVAKRKVCAFGERLWDSTRHNKVGRILWDPPVHFVCTLEKVL